MIAIKSVTHKYNHSSPEEITALKDVTCDIRTGEFIVILGHNGSGKSTLVKLLNALIIPASGDVLVDEINTRSEQDLWTIRSRVGMVFQNPDNQLVAPTTEEELAFGPENLGVPTDEIRERIAFALHAVGMEKYRNSAPHLLSGGQKQKVAIASVLAMYPKYLVLDEPTAMLDQAGRNEVMGTVRALNEEKGITVILVTQNMKEAVLAQRVIVLSQGEIVIDDSPKNAFRDVERMRKLHLEAPPMTMLAHSLITSGVRIPGDILTVEEMLAALSEIRTSRGCSGKKKDL